MGSTMSFDRTVVIAKRDYLSRVKTRGFWIGTLLLPVVMLGMAILPSVFMMKTQGELRLAIVDESHKVGKRLADELLKQSSADSPDPQRGVASRLQIDLEATDGDAEAKRKALDDRVLSESLDAWLWIPADILTANRAEYHGESVSNLVTQEVLERRLSTVVRSIRFSEAGLDSSLV